MNDVGDDRHYIELVKSGDSQAFEVLLRRYQGYVCSLVIKYLSQDSVEEVSQDVFVEAFQSLSTYRGEAPFRSWLATITIRTCYAYLRKRYRNREIAESQLSEGAKDWCRRLSGEVAREQHLEGEEKRYQEELLAHTMSKLEPEDRMIISLLYFEDKSVKEVSRLLNWGIPKVKVRAFRARRALKSLWEELQNT